MHQTRRSIPIFFLLVFLLATSVTSALAFANSWTARAPMPQARSSHEAVLMANGDVMVAGRYEFGSADLTANIYRPANNTWTTTSNLVYPGVAQTLTRLDDGDVLWIGGQQTINGGALSVNHVQRYDTATSTWSAGNGLSQKRHLHTATRLNDGTVLAVGGLDGSLSFFGLRIKSAERYNPSTDQWASAGDTSVDHLMHTATLLNDGRVLVVGGYSPDSSSVAEIYQANNGGSWSTTGSLTNGRREHTATLLPDGRVLVVGGQDNLSGSSAEIYNPSTSQWTTTDSLSQGRTNHDAVPLCGGVLVVGGETTASGFDTLDSAEFFNPTTSQWTTVSTLPRDHHSGILVALDNNNAFLAGGFPGLADSYLYNDTCSNVATAVTLQTQQASTNSQLFSATLLLVLFSTLAFMKRFIYRFATLS